MRGMSQRRTAAPHAEHTQGATPCRGRHVIQLRKLLWRISPPVRWAQQGAQRPTPSPSPTNLFNASPAITSNIGTPPSPPSPARAGQGRYFSRKVSEAGACGAVACCFGASMDRCQRGRARWARGFWGRWVDRRYPGPGRSETSGPTPRAGRGRSMRAGTRVCSCPCPRSTRPSAVAHRVPRGVLSGPASFGTSGAEAMHAQLSRANGATPNHRGTLSDTRSGPGACARRPLGGARRGGRERQTSGRTNHSLRRVITTVACTLAACAAARWI